MKKNTLRALLIFSFASTFALAQAPTIGTPEWAALHTQAFRTGGPVINPLSGNDSLTAIYNNTACGLNYVMVSQRLGQRFTPAGIPQPAPFVVNMSPCAVIQQAFLYTEVLGVASSVTANITNPASVSTSFNMTNIGSSIDVCWGMNGTHVWRTDVTSCFAGPGTYTLSGMPTSLSATVDCEGATLIIIYVDPYASYTGSLKIDDGCHTVASGSLNHNMTGFSVCANSTFANSFMVVGDMQMSGYTLDMNGASVTQPQWNWWNEISATTSVTTGQSTCNFDLISLGDCYTLAVAGLYFQTGCSGCTPTTSPVSLITTSLPDNCNGNGSAAVTASGGSGTYTYLWMPGGQTTSSVSGLGAGTYTVYVNDGADCNSSQVVIGYTGMNLLMSATIGNCITNGTASVAVTGGQAPYTYLWNPTGGTSATATNLVSGWYAVTVTDNSGCSMTDSIEVLPGSGLVLNMNNVSDSCGSGTGSAQAFPWGGTAPYTYLWAPGGQTTSSITGLLAGNYTVTVTDAIGCTDTASVTVGAMYINLFGGTQVVYCGDSIVLNPYIGVLYPANAVVSWSPSTYLSNPNIQNPVCYAPVSITYTLSVTYGCLTATDVVNVIFDSTNYHYDQVCFVTVDTALNKNVVIWERFNSPTTGSYKIYRETSTAGVYALIATQSIALFTTYTDLTSTPSTNPDRYKITSVNSCGDESDTTGHHRTIFLTSTQNGPVWDLAWTAYEGLPIATYNIYGGATVGTMTLLNSVSGSTFTYTDASPQTGINYYMVEAVHPFGGCAPSLRLSGPLQPLENSNLYSNVSAISPNGISESDFYGASFTLMPNPGNGNIQLNVLLTHVQEIQIAVYDNLGRAVYAQKENATSGNYSTMLNLSSLSAGMYTVRVQTPNGFVAKRLVIE